MERRESPGLESGTVCGRLHLPSPGMEPPGMGSQSTHVARDCAGSRPGFMIPGGGLVGIDSSSRKGIFQKVTVWLVILGTFWEGLPWRGSICSEGNTRAPPGSGYHGSGSCPSSALGTVSLSRKLPLVRDACFPQVVFYLAHPSPLRNLLPAQYR